MQQYIWVGFIYIQKYFCRLIKKKAYFCLYNAIGYGVSLFKKKKILILKKTNIIFLFWRKKKIFIGLGDMAKTFIY